MFRHLKKKKKRFDNNDISFKLDKALFFLSSSKMKRIRLMCLSIRYISSIDRNHRITRLIFTEEKTEYIECDFLFSSSIVNFISSFL